MTERILQKMLRIMELMRIPTKISGKGADMHRDHKNLLQNLYSIRKDKTSPVSGT